MPAISLWLCKCGIRFKVVTECDDDNPTEQVEVHCLKCGDRTMVFAEKVVSFEIASSLTRDFRPLRF